VRSIFVAVFALFLVVFAMVAVAETRPGVRDVAVAATNDTYLYVHKIPIVHDILGLHGAPAVVSRPCIQAVTLPIQGLHNNYYYMYATREEQKTGFWDRNVPLKFPLRSPS
jgi:hypothetical protein